MNLLFLFLSNHFFIQLDENVPLDNVEKSLNYFQQIYPMHLGNEKIDHAKLLNNHIKVSRVKQSKGNLESSVVKNYQLDENFYRNNM